MIFRRSVQSTEVRRDEITPINFWSCRAEQRQFEAAGLARRMQRSPTATFQWHIRGGEGVQAKSIPTSQHRGATSIENSPTWSDRVEKNGVACASTPACQLGANSTSVLGCIAARVRCAIRWRPAIRKLRAGYLLRWCRSRAGEWRLPAIGCASSGWRRHRGFARCAFWPNGCDAECAPWHA